MKDILEEILAYKRKEVEREKAELPPEQLFALVEGRWRNAHDGTARHGKVPAYMTDARKHRSMRESLAASRSGIIAEFKRKSPSKGWIKEEGRADVIPAAYAAAGAAALSILTDGKYFGGCLDYIRQARPMTDTPILRKEFIIDEYQLYQACQAGADTVLLIAAALTRPDYEHLTRKAHELGLEVLLEIHTEKELDYLHEHVDLIGVNNRNLGTFHTDVENSFRLARKLPKELLWVSESGISQPDTFRQLREAGFRGFLMGETFMKTPSPEKALSDFLQALAL